MTYSIAQLSTMVDALTIRLALVDGQGLPVGARGTVAVAQAKANGVAADQVQLLGVLQQKLNAIMTAVSGYTASLRQLAGLSAT